MKQFLLSVFITCAFLQANAQIEIPNPASAPYKKIYDKPDSVPNFYILVDFLHVDVYQGEPHFNLGLRSEIPFSKNFSVNFDIRKTYLDGVVNNLIDRSSYVIYANKNGGLTTSHWMEFGVGLTLSDRSIEKKLKVTLQSNSTARIYTKVPGKLRQIFILRSGIIQNRTAVFIDEYTEGYFSNTKNNTDVLNLNEIPPINSPGVSKGDFAATTALNQFGIYVGLSYRLIANLMIDANARGYRGKWDNLNFYADIISMPKMRFDEVKVIYGGKTYQFNSTNLIKQGFRLGFELKNISKAAFAMKFEWGQMPYFAGVDGTTISKGMYATGSVSFGLQRLIKHK